MPNRTRDEVRDAFSSHGVTVVEWARAHGFNPDSVYAVLLGRTRGTRGEAHRIAVALGLKSTDGASNPMAWPTDGPGEPAKPQQEVLMPNH
ncbi:DNA-binding protein [Paraburkholderia bryophila]|uniref:DNA-binding protein n=1 Tax=Paraburkholderia bryophila TaxID=420952 RepID=UPI00234BE979|nr:DNA-binding protein [Paraburkholderia bryophila]WCM24917.1 DNA-binding protein [Paraburkholderia bryophila]